MANLVANALNKRVVERVHAVPALVGAGRLGGRLLQPASRCNGSPWAAWASCRPWPKAQLTRELSWDDATETASFVKKGGYLGMTLEAIDKDDTGRLRAAPRALAQAAWLTLAKAVSGDLHR